MNFKKFHVFLLVASLSACTTLNTSRSTPTYAVIYEDPLIPSSMSYLDSLANAHCSKYDSVATFEKKDWGIMSPNVYYYNCTKKLQNSSDIQPAANVSNVKNKDIESTKKTCSDIGFKPGTEGFGKCVLQLTK